MNPPDFPCSTSTPHFLTTSGGVLVPATVFLCDGIDPSRSLTGRIIAEVYEHGVPPLTHRDMLFLTSTIVGVRFAIGSIEPNQRLTREVVTPFNVEGLSAVASVAPGLVTQEGFNAPVLALAHTVFVGTHRRRIREMLESLPGAAEAPQGSLRAAFRREVRATERMVAEELKRWAHGFNRWYQTRMIPAQSHEARRADPDIAALFEWECRLRDRYVKPHVVSIDQASAELLSALRRPRYRWLLSWRDEFGETRGAEDMILDLLFLDTEHTLDERFYRGRDGKIHRNSRFDADRLRERRNCEDRSKGHKPIVAADQVIDAGAEDPAEAIASVHAVRDGRELQEECHLKGAKYEAAFERLALGGGSRRKLAERLGTSEKAIRHAEQWVQDRLNRLGERHAG